MLPPPLAKALGFNSLVQVFKIILTVGEYEDLLRALPAATRLNAERPLIATEWLAVDNTLSLFAALRLTQPERWPVLAREAGRQSARFTFSTTALCELTRLVEPRLVIAEGGGDEDFMRLEVQWEG